MLTLFGMGFFGAAHKWWGQKAPFPKICHAYPAMMRLRTVIPYLTEIKKIRESRDTPLSSADNVLPEISKFCYIKKYMYRLHFDTKFRILLTILESLKIVLIEKVRILMMSAKMSTPGLLKMKAL